MGWRRTIGRHAKLMFVHLSIRPTPAERPWGGCDGECRPPDAARGIPANAQATGSDNLRSAVLGRFVLGLARLAKSALEDRRRQVLHFNVTEHPTAER